MLTRRVKVVVAMSGGVDSSVAAGLLVEQGYDIQGVSLRLWESDDLGSESRPLGTCCFVTGRRWGLTTKETAGCCQASA